MNIFDIIGPVMVGPSSSHTLGAARIGLIARKLLNDEPYMAIITLYGSFSLTYQGHGTDKAIVGGILGFSSDDLKIRESFKYAKDIGLQFSFVISSEETEHPNTVKIDLTGKSGSNISAVARSVGAGRIEVISINGSDVLFSCEYDTTIIFNRDKPGLIAHISKIFSDFSVNIAFMRVFRKYEGKDAIMVIETDQKISDDMLIKLSQTQDVQKVITVPPFMI
ncbi:MAG: L-serine ammonia-lyase, iron-sulfur-dependent subunit beta [Clostridia bacterium]|nr:L-serine ammonia-lyase, iron-sulfur-dependent subunit beta [Clostridia bacterium]